MDIGVIAEDNSDVAVLYELTSKLITPNRFAFKRWVGGGCGMLRRKCAAWAKNLLQRGCTHLVVIHDLDTNLESKLREELTKYIKDIAFDRYIILIPIHEVESWLLADAAALQKVFNMNRIPQTPCNPEAIMKPKERLRDIVFKNTKKEKRYLNTIHNQKIAKELRIGELKRKCASFRSYPVFIANII